MAPKEAPKHPKYEEMVADAISSLKDRTGSSLPAIVKFVDTKYSKDLPENWKKLLSVQLKRLVESGKLTKVKASYKLGEALKKPAKNPAVKKPAVKKVVVAKKPAVKKPAAKKMTKTKTPTKKVTKPKAAKSPAKKATKPKAVGVTKKTASKKKTPAKK
eukprot:CAMPEP_0117678328 /NCGR_PEP_ID=MMETSP0804-20121206/17237_1 /TAXON_ID=1074897 /ORGANISM="Tetraselmis astigmatica, Strain CCMP880" /LENGTH=158 /DNA_ID=CAMNT_0005487705 /DNA_START=34 /DNA_END=510 /DNA_ORIENTATION=-